MQKFVVHSDTNEFHKVLNISKDGQTDIKLELRFIHTKRTKYNIFGGNGAFPPTRNGSIHPILSRNRHKNG